MSPGAASMSACATAQSVHFGGSTSSFCFTGSRMRRVNRFSADSTTASTKWFCATQAPTTPKVQMLAAVAVPCTNVPGLDPSDLRMAPPPMNPMPATSP